MIGNSNYPYKHLNRSSPSQKLNILVFQSGTNYSSLSCIARRRLIWQAALPWKEEEIQILEYKYLTHFRSVSQKQAKGFRHDCYSIWFHVYFITADACSVDGAGEKKQQHSSKRNNNQCLTEGKLLWKGPRCNSKYWNDCLKALLEADTYCWY